VIGTCLKVLDSFRLAGATGEWALHAICHNLRKLGNRRVATAEPGSTASP